MTENKATPLLRINDLSKHFGGLAAVENLDFNVNEGEIIGLIGPNGAGKTTVFNMISGFLKPTRGQVVFNGADITRKKPSWIAKQGLIRTFQANVIYKDFSVIDNVLMGCHLNTGFSLVQDFANLMPTRKKKARLNEKVDRILEFGGLTDYREELAHNLSHGYQRLLGICIALAADPCLILLDEPVSGMNAEEKQAMMALIKKINEQNITVLIVEHDMKVIMNLCERITVINFGMKIAEGTPGEIQANPKVIEAYLGVE